jgi:hypothetical protein
MNNVVSAAYQVFETTIEGDEYRNNRWFFMARSSNRIKLPLDLIMELTADYRGPLAYGVYQLEGQWGMDLGFQRSFLSDKLELSLSFRDVFRTRRIRASVGLGENIALIDQYLGDRSVRLGLRYHFSKGERFEGADRRRQLEELQRAN